MVLRRILFPTNRVPRARTRVFCALTFAPILALPFALVPGGPAPAQPWSVTPPQLVVEAEGRVTATPDIATIALGVAQDGKTARLALDALNAGLAGVMARLAAEGIAPRDVQTSGLMLAPRRDRYDGSAGGPPTEGFVAASDVTVRVRDLDRLGQILDAVVSDGANLFRGVSFDITAPGPLLDEARRQAVAEARRKAELYASAAGVTLGPLRSLTEQGGGRPMPMLRMDAASMQTEAVPVAAGEVSLSVSVLLTYGIGQP